MGVGKERKMNDGPATADQTRDREKELKQKLLLIGSAIKSFCSRSLFDKRGARYFRCPDPKETHLENHGN
jgi:hypothetical protein